MEVLRAAVSKRCAELGVSAGATPPEGDEFESASLFKWDRPCELALHTVVTASQRAGGCGYAQPLQPLLALIAPRPTGRTRMCTKSFWRAASGRPAAWMRKLSSWRSAELRRE